MNLFINNLFTDPAYFFGIALVVIFSICCHEYMHAWIALKQGDPTAADQGHLTLNPLKQMGVMSLVMFALIGIAWGQVPVRPAYMKHRWSHALVAFAGPATNLLLFFVFGLAAFCFGHYKLGSEFAFRILLTGSVLNVVLFILNMLPVPGLDGWAILDTFVPRLSRTRSELLSGTFFAAALLVFLFINQLYKLGVYLVTKYFELLLAIAEKFSA